MACNMDIIVSIKDMFMKIYILYKIPHISNILYIIYVNILVLVSIPYYFRFINKNDII